MNQYEYTTVEGYKGPFGDFKRNSMGREGWEMCSFYELNEIYFETYKRLKNIKNQLNQVNEENYT